MSWFILSQTNLWAIKEIVFSIRAMNREDRRKPKFYRDQLLVLTHRYRVSYRLTFFFFFSSTSYGTQRFWSFFITASSNVSRPFLLDNIHLVASRLALCMHTTTHTITATPIPCLGRANHATSWRIGHLGYLFDVVVRFWPSDCLRYSFVLGDIIPSRPHLFDNSQPGDPTT